MRQWLIEKGHIVLAGFLAAVVFTILDYVVPWLAPYAWGIGTGIGFILGRNYARRHD